MIVRTIKVFVKREYVAEFEEATLANHLGSLQEPGVLRFDVLKDPELIPYFASVRTGLIKAPADVAETLWAQLEEAGRRCALDRMEQGYAVDRDSLRGVRLPDGGRVRDADYDDLQDLVDAARLSLREEDRPDPFRGDPHAFRSWVAARIPRARVGEHDLRRWREPRADDGPARRPDPGVLQYSAGQHIRLAHPAR